VLGTGFVLGATGRYAQQGGLLLNPSPVYRDIPSCFFLFLNESNTIMLKFTIKVLQIDFGCSSRTMKTT